MLTLESLFTRALELNGYKPTPAQLAICRVADGKPLGTLWKSPAVRRLFNDVRPTKLAPKHMVILAGIRGGKSLLAACKAICTSQNIDLEGIGMHEEPRIPVLSTEVDLAHVVYAHIHGILEAFDDLRELIVKVTADTIRVRHPSGRVVEIKVTAMSRAGSTLVARWLAGCIFDEAPRMTGDGSVKSLGESMRAISGRMLPGSQIWLIGSPHAPFGPVYDIQAEWFGKDSDVYAVVRARGPDLNPVWWTPERCEAQRLEDEDVWLTDVMAQFADPEESLISSVDLDACTRDETDVMLPVRGLDGRLVYEYSAYMDPATRGNAWTLHIVECSGIDENDQPRYRLIAKQWMGSKLEPLSPRKVLTEIAQLLKPFGVTDAMTDQWSVDALRDIAEQVGLDLHELSFDSDNRLALAKRVALLLRTRRLSLPADKQLRTDLLMAKNRVTQNGATLVLPQTGDGRHCDHLPPLLLMAHSPPMPPEDPEPPNIHGEFAHLMEQTREEAELGAMGRACRVLM